MSEILRLENISVRCGEHLTVSAPVSVLLHAGETSFLAESLEAAITDLILGEARVLSGSGTLLGYPLVGMSSRRRRELLRRIGILSPNDILFGNMSLHDFLDLPLKIAGLNFAQRSRRIRSTLSEFDLSLQGNRPLSTLSRTDIRLAAVAQALIKSPALIIGEIRSDEFDQSVIAPMLRNYALHGGAVLVFGKLHSEKSIVTLATGGAEFAPTH